MYILLVVVDALVEHRTYRTQTASLRTFQGRISLQALASQLDLGRLPDPLWELAHVGQPLARHRYQLAQAEWESTARASHERPLPRASLRALRDSSCFLLLYMLAILKRGP